MTSKDRERLAEVMARPYKHYCTCGGFAWQMNGRPEKQPHMSWCPQLPEHLERQAALAAAPKPGDGA